MAPKMQQEWSGEIEKFIAWMYVQAKVHRGGNNVKRDQRNSSNNNADQNSWTRLLYHAQQKQRNKKVFQLSFS